MRLGFLILGAAAIAAPAAAKKATYPVPSCQGAEDCEVRWGKALRWVLDHNGRLAQQTDTFIATAPIQQTGEDYFQVSRIPVGDGRYDIEMKMECANAFSCKLKDRKQGFYDAVSGG